jgi:SNF2 family DNA or RNA helicase
MHYHAGLNGVERDNTIQKFLSDSKQRVLIASTLAIGEGTNLQPVADAIMLERQWTPVPEEQAECRFPRPGATADRIDIRYITALGTIDEMLAELVEKKRQIIGEAINGGAEQWDQTAIMRELAQLLYKQGKEKWSFHN